MMMEHEENHYKVLGLSRNASKEEIKAAFKRLAVTYHPDKHSQSTPSVRDAATLRFKLITHAYDTLVDDRKRADYNIRSSSSSSSYSHSNHHYNRHGYGYGYGYNHYYNNSYSANRSYQPSNFSGAFTSKMEILLRFLTTRDFLRSLAFAVTLVGGAVVIDMSKDALWKMHNSGKSFEEALESIEKAKAHKDKR